MKNQAIRTNILANKRCVPEHVQLQRFGKTKTLIVFSTSVDYREKYWENDLPLQEEK